MIDGRPVAAVLEQPAELLEALSPESRIVFDLDGTLYDTRDFERPALASVVDWLSEKSGRQLSGMARALSSRRESDRHRPGLFDDLLKECGLPETWGEECFRRFHAYSGVELERAASLKEQVADLRSGGRRMALVSNGDPALQQRKLARLDLVDAFDICVYCDPRQPEQLKPSSWAWTQLAEWRSISPAVYVGDDAVDAAFAAAGGARFVPFRFRSPSYGD